MASVLVFRGDKVVHRQHPTAPRRAACDPDREDVTLMPEITARGYPDLERCELCFPESGGPQDES